MRSLFKPVQAFVVSATLICASDALAQEARPGVFGSDAHGYYSWTDAGPPYGSSGGVVRYRRDPGDEFPYPVWCYDPPGACTNPFSTGGY